MRIIYVYYTVELRFQCVFATRDLLDQLPQAHLLLTLSLVCGAGVFWAEGNRLFSKDNNYRNEIGSAVLPEDWLMDPYWGAWLVGEWVGTLIAGICVVRPDTMHPALMLPLYMISLADCVLYCHSVLHQPWKLLQQVY